MERTIMTMLERMRRRVQRRVDRQSRALELEAAGGMPHLIRNLFQRVEHAHSDILNTRDLARKLVTQFSGLRDHVDDVGGNTSEILAMLNKEDERLNQLIGEAAIMRLERKLDWIHQRLKNRAQPWDPTLHKDVSWSEPTDVMTSDLDMGRVLPFALPPRSRSQEPSARAAQNDMALWMDEFTVALHQCIENPGPDWTTEGIQRIEHEIGAWILARDVVYNWPNVPEHVVIDEGVQSVKTIHTGGREYATRSRVGEITPEVLHALSGLAEQCKQAITNLQSWHGHHHTDLAMEIGEAQETAWQQALSMIENWPMVPMGTPMPYIAPGPDDDAAEEFHRGWAAGQAFEKGETEDEE